VPGKYPAAGGAGLSVNVCVPVHCENELELRLNIISKRSRILFMAI
jgi:hypothetical protein